MMSASRRPDGKGPEQATDPLPPSLGATAPATAPPVVQLRVVGEDLMLPLDRREVFTLGCGLDVDLHLPRQYVSRLHATIRRLASGALEVTAHGQNGVRIEGRNVDECHVRAGDIVSMAKTRLLLLDEPMVTLRWVLARTLGFRAHAAVDHALTLAIRHVHAPLVLTGPKGAEPEHLAHAIHLGSPRRGLPFVALDARDFDREDVRAIQGAGEGTVYVDLRALRGRAAANALVRALVGPLAQARVIVAAQSADHLRAAFDSPSTRLDEIRTPEVSTRREEIPALLDAYIAAELQSPHRITELGRDRLDALCDFDWPGNLEEIRRTAQRVVAYLDAGGNLTVAARSLGVSPPTLLEALRRIGVVTRRERL